MDFRSCVSRAIRCSTCLMSWVTPAPGRSSLLSKVVDRLWALWRQQQQALEFRSERRRLFQKPGDRHGSIHYNTFGLDDANFGSDVPVSLVSDYHIFDTASSSALCAEYFNGVRHSQHPRTNDCVQSTKPNLGRTYSSGLNAIVCPGIAVMTNAVKYSHRARNCLQCRNVVI